MYCPQMWVNFTSPVITSPRLIRVNASRTAAQRPHPRRRNHVARMGDGCEAYTGWKSEGRMESANKTLQAIFDQAAVGIAQIGLNGEWLSVNQRYCEMLGYSKAELLTKTLHEINHPDECGEVLAGRRQLLEGSISSHSMEKRYIRKDGTVFWGRLNRTLVRDNDNQPKFFIALVEDITERKQAEAALRQSEQLNKQVLDNIPICIFVFEVTTDFRFKFIGLNPAEENAVGLSSSEVSGRFVEDVLSEDIATKVIAHYRRCLEAGTIVSYEEELDLPIGLRYFRTNLIPIRDADGRIYRIVGCCSDLTDMRRAQAEAFVRQKLESVGVLAGGIAHDFNNLLGSILTEAELVEADLAAGLSPHEEIARIKKVAIRGAEIVRELMIYAGQDQQGGEEAFDLSQVTAEMLELMKVSISKRAVLKIDLGKNLPLIWGKASQIRQVLMNLVMNASEAIGENEGTIEVATSRVGANYVRLDVSDSGCGMTEAIKAKIFDPFFTTKFVGRGLGLAVVQGIVRAHGGGLDVRSAPGLGATFQVLLPCTSKKALDAPFTATSAGAESYARMRMGATVLVVEDEEVLRLAISKALRIKGFTVMEAEDGSIAMHIIRTLKDDIDVILLDVTLPGTSSKVVFEEAQHTRASMKIVLTSAYDRKTVEDLFTGLRVSRFIRKPFQLDDLVGILREELPEAGAEKPMASTCQIAKTLFESA
jgi:two-component system, cell cycle sensor histidine kinase and response regulator CckA